MSHLLQKHIRMLPCRCRRSDIWAPCSKAQLTTPVELLSPLFLTTDGCIWDLNLGSELRVAAPSLSLQGQLCQCSAMGQQQWFCSWQSSLGWLLPCRGAAVPPSWPPAATRVACPGHCVLQWPQRVSMNWQRGNQKNLRDVKRSSLSSTSFW